MLTSIRTFGDRLLRVLMPSAEAGACVPTNGHPCSVPGRLNCNGDCIT
jgi:hypothetical protein